MKEAFPATLEALVPSALRGALGGRPLIGDEDPVAYDALLGTTAAAVGPKDPFEWFLVKDLVDLAWEVQRWRRLKAATLRSAECDFALEQVLEPLAEASGVFESPTAFAATMEACRSGDAQALERAKEALLRCGRDWSTVSARALAARLPEVERLDLLISRAEARRHSMGRELDRHRQQVSALPPRSSSGRVIEVEVARSARGKKHSA